MGANVDGCQKKITVKETKDFSIVDLKELLVAEFKTEKNKHYFNDSLIEIGDNNEKMYEDFINSNHEKCSFGKFCCDIRNGNRIKICLYTTELSNDYETFTESNTDTLQNNNSFSAKQFNVPKNDFKKPIAPSQVKQKSSSSPSYSVLTNRANASNICANNNNFRNNNMNFIRPKDSAQNSSPSKDLINSSESLKQATSFDLDFQNKQVMKLKSLNLGVPIIEKVSTLKFINKLGEGGQGQVFKGTWNYDDVAIKTFKIDSSNCEKFILREIVFLAKVKHPNIIQLMAVCPNVDKYYIVMDLCDGHSLFHILHRADIKKEYDLSLNMKNRICFQISKAVTYLHNHPNGQIVHRDIKPLNILVYKNYFVKLCDLGISKCDDLFSDSLKTFGVHNFKGTSCYMPPETLIDKKAATIKSDTFSLGCTISEIYTEKSLLGSDLIQIILNFSAKKSPELSQKHIPSETFQLLERSLSYDPTHRPTAHELLLHFKKISLND